MEGFPAMPGRIKPLDPISGRVAHSGGLSIAMALRPTREIVSQPRWGWERDVHGVLADEDVAAGVNAAFGFGGQHFARYWRRGLLKTFNGYNRGGSFRSNGSERSRHSCAGFM